MRDSRIGARQRVGAYPQSQTRRSFGADGHDSGRADDATSRAAGDLHDQLHGAATGCFGVATSMSPFPLAPRAALGRLEGRAAATRSRARASSLSPGPPGCIRRRPGGRSDRVGLRLCRSRRRRSCLVPTSLQTIACRSRRLRPGAMRAWHGRRRLPAIRIKCSANTQGAGRARHVRLCVQIAGGRACCHRSAPDLHRVGSRRRRPSALQKVRRFR
jgi:hypothetical protein